LEATQRDNDARRQWESNCWVYEYLYFHVIAFAAAGINTIVYLYIVYNSCAPIKTSYTHTTRTATERQTAAMARRPATLESFADQDAVRYRAAAARATLPRGAIATLAVRDTVAARSWRAAQVPTGHFTGSRFEKLRDPRELRCGFPGAGARDTHELVGARATLGASSAAAAKAYVPACAPLP